MLVHEIEGQSNNVMHHQQGLVGASRLWLRVASLGWLVVLLSLLSCSTRREQKDARLQQFAGANELDGAFAFDPQTGVLAFAHDSGRGGIWMLDTRVTNAAARKVPTEGKWPKAPILAPGGRYYAWHDYDPERGSHELALYLGDRVTGQTRGVVRAKPNDRVSRAVFTPDGKALVYELIHLKATVDNDEIRRIDLETFSDTLLVASGNKGARAPMFSQDGRDLYFYAAGCIDRLTLETGARETLGCLPEGATLNPKYIGKPPVISADGSRIVFTMRWRGCPRIGVLDVGTKTVRLLDEHECGSDPELLDSRGEEVAYVGLPLDGRRIVRVRKVGGTARTIGPEDAMTYEIAVDGRSVLAVAATAETVRGLWRYDVDSTSRSLIVEGDEAGLATDLVRSSEVVKIPSFDGLVIPVRMFYPRCRTGAKGPLVLYIHGSPLGKDDVPPRLSLEIGYLLGQGATVAAINFRGSTGHGDDFGRQTNPTDQARDVVAVARAFQGRDDVDPSQVYAMGICYAADEILPHVLEEAGASLRGVIAWAGATPRWWKPSSPATLWVETVRDGRAPQRAGAEVMSQRGRVNAESYEHVRVDETHVLLDGNARREALAAVGRFLESRNGNVCE